MESVFILAPVSSAKISVISVATVRERSEESLEVFPASSLAVNDIKYVPSAWSGVVIEKSPLSSIVEVKPESCPSIYKVTSLPLSAEPWIVEVEL